MTGVVCAQSEPWREVDSPYQEDLKFGLGESLSPKVDINGVRWRSLRISVAEGETVADGETVNLDVALEFENRTPSSVKLLVILLLEDADGAPLERIELKPFKVGGERFKERAETATSAGDVLLAAHRIYVFCEIQD